MADLSREEFLIHIGYLLDAVKEVKSQVVIQNGRTAIVENKLAVLEIKVETVKQAVEAAGQTGSDRTARMTGVGSALAAATALIWQWLQRP
jgi:hypothetical protein